MNAKLLTTVLGGLLGFAAAGAAFASEPQMSSRESRFCPATHASYSAFDENSMHALLRAKAEPLHSKANCLHAKVEPRRRFGYHAVRVAARPVRHAEPSPAPAQIVRLDSRDYASSCSGGTASILCPGYQLVGFEY